MKRKKFILWIMVLIGVMIWMNTGRYTMAASSVKVKISDAATAPGGEFEVMLSFESAKEIGGFELKVPYNNQQFEFISAEAIVKMSQFDVIESNGMLSVVAILTEDINLDSIEICKIKLKAKEKASEGNYQIVCSEGELIKGSTYENVTFDKIAGNITVRTIQKGDIDENGKINITDAMRVFHYVSGRNRNLSEKQIEAADINGDGKISIVDAMRVFHHVSGRKLITETTKPSEISVTGVSLNQTSLNLIVGGNSVLTATVLPTDASDKSISWSCSNTNVATVDNTGKVVAKGAGQAVITVKTNNGAKTATCTITVASATVPITGVTISNKKTLALDFNDASNKTYQCNISVTPSNATNKAVSWSSSDTKVATVDSNGKITAIARGTATITVKTSDGAKTDTIKVYVYKTDAGILDGWTGNDKALRLKLSSNQNLVLDVLDGNTYNGAKVQLWTNNQSSAQLWQFHNYTASHGGIAVVPICNNGSYILDVNRGGNNLTDPFKENNRIDLWSLGDDDAASMWELVRLWDDTYIIRLKNTRWVVGATAAVQGAELGIRELDVFDTNQRWVIEVVAINQDSSQNFNSKVEAFKKAVPEGHCHNNEAYTVNGVTVGWQCFGFANLMAYNIWGSYPSTLSNATNVSSNWTIIRASAANSQIGSLKTGDIVRFRNGSYDHSIFVTNIVGDIIYYADCNGDGNDVVHYSRTMSKNSLSQKMTQQLIYDSGYYGWIAHCKSN